MAGETFVKIATVDVGAGGAGTISFSAIPDTYSDLKILLSSRNTAPNADAKMIINGSSASLNTRQQWADGFNVGNDNYANGPSFYINGSGFAAGSFGVAEIYVFDYKSTTRYKTVYISAVNEENANYGGMVMNATVWSNNSAITTITFTPAGGGSFAQYSTATLYGIKVGTGGATVTTA